MMSAYHWKNGIGDFCVANYLAELNVMHFSPSVVGMKSPGDVRIGESPALGVGWSNSRLRSEAPKKRGATLRRFMVREVKCAALR
jgi:hypothetical protein